MHNDLKKYIREIPNFPKAGISFKDITTLLGDAFAFGRCIDDLADHYKDQRISKVVAIESRGFLFGAPLAKTLGCGLALVRKSGKLPAQVHRESYQLEYGQDTLEIHHDAVHQGERAIIVDDVLATGGTALATTRLLKRLQADIVGFAFVIELAFLQGRAKLAPYDTFTLVSYDSE